MPKTWLEIQFDDRQIADLEHIAETEGCDIDDVVRMSCKAFTNIYEKEQKK